MKEANFGIFEMVCHAPLNYDLIKKSATVGYEDPEDVRWEEVDQNRNFIEQTNWINCTVPDCNGLDNAGIAILMERITFTYVTGLEQKMWMGQCPRCKTIHWQK